MSIKTTRSLLRCDSLAENSACMKIGQFEIRQYKEDIEGSEYEFRDYVRCEAPNIGATVLANKVFHFTRDFWAFSNPADIPANRWFQVDSYVQLATMQTTLEDLRGGYAEISRLIHEGLIQEAEKLSSLLAEIIELSDEGRKWINLATCFLFLDNENPMVFDNRNASIKREILFALPEEKKNQVYIWILAYFTQLIEYLQTVCPLLFKSESEENEEELPFFEIMAKFSNKQNDINLMLLQMSKGDLQQRDYILNYGIGDLYADIHYFIIQNKRETKSE